MKTDDPAHDHLTIEQVRGAFASLTDDLVPPDGDADRMVLAGRRRLRRRRAMSMVAAVAAGIVVAAGGLVATSSRTTPWIAASAPEPSPTFTQGAIADLYGKPPRGDLAHDATYRAEVIAAWTASHGQHLSLTSGIFDDLRGDPHVIWAGRTPAGPAAVVAQPAFWRQRGPHKTSDEIMVTLVGVVGVDDHGNAKVIEDDYQPIDSWFVNPSLTTLVILDLGYPVSYSTGWTYRPDGSRYLMWIPAHFVDGAAVISLPHDVDVCAVRLRMPDGVGGRTEPSGAADWTSYCQRKGGDGETSPTGGRP